MSNNKACLTYWVRLDPNGYPTAGSMQGFPDNESPCMQVCQWAQLKTTPYTIPQGKQQCRQPDGLRYFYQIGRNGQIVPNSLQVTRQFPQSPGGCAFWIEWLKLCNS